MSQRRVYASRSQCIFAEERRFNWTEYNDRYYDGKRIIINHDVCILELTTFDLLQLLNISEKYRSLSFRKQSVSEKVKWLSVSFIAFIKLFNFVLIKLCITFQDSCLSWWFVGWFIWQGGQRDYLHKGGFQSIYRCFMCLPQRLPNVLPTNYIFNRAEPEQ